MVFWAKTIVDEGKPQPADGEEAESAAAVRLCGRGHDGAARRGTCRAAVRASASEAEDDEGDNPELDEYNAYLAELQQQVQGHGRWHGLR